MTDEKSLADLLREISAARATRPPPEVKPVEFEFMDTAEGVVLIAEDGFIRGATRVEQYFRNRYAPGGADEPPLRTAERAIVRALMDSGLAETGQSQVTHVDHFEIATDDIIVRVSLLVEPDPDDDVVVRLQKP